MGNGTEEGLVPWYCCNKLSHSRGESGAAMAFASWWEIRGQTQGATHQLVIAGRLPLEELVNLSDPLPKDIGDLLVIDTATGWAPLYDDSARPPLLRSSSFIE